MRFGGLTAVKQVDFTIEKGMIASLIGPNGAGKTTFFNMLTGFMSPLQVSYGWGLETITGASLISLQFWELLERSRISAIQQHDGAGKCTGGRHSPTERRFSGTLLVPSDGKQEERKARQKAVRLPATFVSLGASKAQELAKNLSYGDQRRLEIARALASDPKILLLDEPTAGMNPNETADLTRFIHRIRDELDLSILLIEHDMKVVMGISDRVSVMEYGSKIAEGTQALFALTRV
jgi:branched-chain amino acid transport system ATP-binding protein